MEYVLSKFHSVDAPPTGYKIPAGMRTVSDLIIGADEAATLFHIMEEV